MKDLNYDHSLYYSLKEKHKSLEIKDFKTKNILGIEILEIYLDSFDISL